MLILVGKINNNVIPLESVMTCIHLILCCPSSSCLQSFPASGSFPMNWLFASGGQNIGASPSVSVLPMDYSGLISFRIDWFDLFVVQGTLKSLIQHDLKVSVLQHSAFFMVQFSHPYMITGKDIVLTIGTLSTEWCLCFWIHCLGFSRLSFQGADIF